MKCMKLLNLIKGKHITSNLKEDIAINENTIKYRKLVN